MESPPAFSMQLTRSQLHFTCLPLENDFSSAKMYLTKQTKTKNTGKREGTQS